MGIDIDSAGSRYPFMDFEMEPVRNNLFIVEFDTSEIVFNDDAYRRFLMLRAQNVTVPGYSLSTQTDNFLNQATSYVTGLTTQGSSLTLSINFVDVYAPVNIAKLLSDWRSLIENLDDFTMNFNRFYVTNFKITVLHLDGSPFKAFMFYDVFPTNVPTITEYRYSTTPGFVTLSATFTARIFKPVSV